MREITLLFLLFCTINTSFSQVIVKQKKGKYAIVKKGTKAKKKNYIYSAVKEDYNDFFLVKENSKWGLLNSSGKKIAQSIYDTIYTSGYCYIAKLGNYFGAIDTSGKNVIPFKYQQIHSASINGDGTVKKEGKWASLEDGKLFYEKEKVIFSSPHKLPMFKNCPNAPQNYKDLKSCADKKLLEFIYQNIHYPKQAVAKGIEGMVVISFTVTDNGDIKNIKILREIGGGCGDAAKDLFKDQEQWIPAVHDGKNVYCKYNIPIRFKLSKK